MLLSTSSKREKQSSRKHPERQLYCWSSVEWLDLSLDLSKGSKPLRITSNLSGEKETMAGYKEQVLVSGEGVSELQRKDVYYSG